MGSGLWLPVGEPAAVGREDGQTDSRAAARAGCGPE